MSYGVNFDGVLSGKKERKKERNKESKLRVR